MARILTIRSTKRFRSASVARSSSVSSVCSSVANAACHVVTNWLTWLTIASRMSFKSSNGSSSRGLRRLLFSKWSRQRSLLSFKETTSTRCSKSRMRTKLLKVIVKASTRLMGKKLSKSKIKTLKTLLSHSQAIEILLALCRNKKSKSRSENQKGKPYFCLRSVSRLTMLDEGR